jgi:aminopeptidase
VTDPRLTRLADILVNYSTKVKLNDWVHIQAGRISVPLVREIVAQALKAGGRPTIQLESDQIEQLFMDQAGPEQLGWASPLDVYSIEKMDVAIFISAPENTRAMSAIDPARQQARQNAYRGWVETYMRRSAAGELRWVIANFPCLALAQEADMSLADYEDFVFAATFADQPDPVARWQAIHAEQQRLVDWLAGKQTVEIHGPQAELRLSIAGRTFINSSGDQNMPSGEIFTGPVEDSANGWVRFSYPAIMLGKEVEGVRLEFRDGRVVEATADKNQDFLLTMLDTDEGARRLGELGIGTNFGITRFSKDILFDEKIGGTFHLAVGSSYPETGGKNESAIHWDMICDAHQDTRIRVDGEVFYENGAFKV